MTVYRIGNWPDDLFDCSTKRYYYDTPINKYDIKCNFCSFPEIDETPEPYFIRKKFAYSNLEISEANLGNLFLSDRLKIIFSTLFPDQLDYKPVFIENTNIKTKWWLGVIKNYVITGEIKDEIPKCNKCNEPLHWHPGSQSKYWYSDLESDFDIVKSRNWHSIDEKDWKITWIDRDVLFSKRLIELLKKLKAKGIWKSGSNFTKKAITEVKEWVEVTYDSLHENIKSPIIEVFDDKKKQQIIQKIKKMAILTKTPKQNMGIKLKFENEIIELFKQLDKPLKLSNDADFSIMKYNEWEKNLNIEGNKQMNYIDFASDLYGNYYSFDGNNKNYPIYYFNHEQIAFEQTYRNIYEFCDVML